MLKSLLKSPEPNTALKVTPIIGVLGAKGGVGASTTAINLALAYANIYGGCTLVDANLQQPDLAAFLDLHSPYSLVDLVNRHSPADADVLGTCTAGISETSPNCRLLAPSRTGDAYLHTTLTAVCQCIGNLRASSSSWIVDLPKHLDKHLVAAFDLCDQILVVFEPTLVAVNSVHRWLNVLNQLEYPQAKVSLVLNRAGGRIKGVEEQVGKVFSGLPVTRLPNSYELLEKLSAIGEPALARHAREPYGVAITALAQATALAAQHSRREER
jgi:pilus assembly protein CpaE